MKEDAPEKVKTIAGISNKYQYICKVCCIDKYLYFGNTEKKTKYMLMKSLSF